MDKQLWSAVAVVFVGYLVSMLYQTAHTDRQVEGLRREMEARFAAIDKRFDDFRQWIGAEFGRMGEKLGRIDDRMARLEDRDGKIEDRMERPVVRA